MNPSIDPSQLPLRDIHLPDPVGWWPPAPGWWLLVALAVAAMGYALLLRYRSRRHRAALRAVARIAADLEAGSEPVQCVQALSTVLRRFAMTLAAAGGMEAEPRKKGWPIRRAPQEPTAPPVAGLAGARWLEYLDARWPRADFSGAGAALAHAPYAPPSRVSREEAEALARLCTDWIKAQRL
jgi:hypothetical protein